MTRQRASGTLGPLLAFALVFTMACTGQASGTAAMVGGEPVSTQDVHRIADQWRKAQQQQAGADGGGQALPERRLEQLALLQLIKIKLVMNLAIKEGVEVRADELARTASSQLEPGEFSHTGWNKTDFEAAMRSSILSKALGEKLFPVVDVSDTDMRSYFSAHPDLFQAGWKATVTLAFFKNQADALRLSQLNDPHGRFEDDARRAGASQVLPAQSVDSGSPLPPSLINAISTLESRVASAPIGVQNGFWVAYATQVGHFGQQPYDAARPEIQRHLGDQRRQAAFNSWLTERLREADVHVEPRYGHWPQDFL